METRSAEASGNLGVLKSPLLWCVVAGLLAIGLVDRWYARHKERRFDSHIIRAAARHGVDPALVKAVVWRESKFDAKVRGRAGEVGLMQIGALAAKEWAQAEMRQPGFEGNLFDPGTNLQVGTWYLGKLLKRYARTDNPVAYALADYNAGRSNVLRWNKGAAETNSSIFLEQMTFPGTREYVRSIVERSVKYQGTLTRPKESAGPPLVWAPSSASD
jgi:soluble lytic murein transglycosylase